MAKGIVLQSVDSVRRDLEWRIYMAYKLSCAGYDSVIGSKEDIRNIHSGSRNCIFLGRLDSNTGRMDVDRKYLDDMARRNTKLFFLHDEGALYFSGEYEESVRRIYPEEYFSLPVMKKILFWGEKQRQFFNDDSYQDKLEVTGFPRFDLYQPEFSCIDDESTSRLRKKYGDFILVCGRFAAVNTVPDDPGYLSKRLYDIRVEGGSLEHRSKNDILISMFDSWEKAAKEFASFLPAIAKLAMANPDVNFVVRPHPAERESLYVEALAHFDNVFIDKNGDVRPFVRAAKMVVHSECTTGIEAEIAKVPNVNFRPCMDEETYEPYTVSAVNEVGVIAGNYQELESAFDRISNSDFSFKQAEFGVQDYIANVASDVNSADRIINIINEFNNEDAGSARLLDAGNFIKFLVSTLRLKAKRIAKVILGRLGVARFDKRGYSSGDLKNASYGFEEVLEVWQALGGERALLSYSSGVFYVKGKTL